MEEKVEEAYLYDFYGELLNEHQRAIFEAFMFEDLSLSEIAEMEGISRQGVHDLIRRCSKTLAGYEEKLHLFARFQKAKQQVEEIQGLTKAFREKKEDALLQQIEQISQDILEEL